jgi:hypothetical protein
MRIKTSINVLYADADTNNGIIDVLPTVVQMLESWGISRVCQGILLGLPVRTVTRSLKGFLPSRLNQDQITRMSALLNIHVNLHRLYNEHNASVWLTRPNSREIFAGKAPIIYALERGIPGLLAINTLLLSDMTDYPTTTYDERKAGENFELVINVDLGKFTARVNSSADDSCT